jgi:uncharacterized membrane protein
MSYVLAVVVAASLMIVVVAETVSMTRPQSGDAYTEFYLRGADGSASNYPKQALAGAPITVTVGIGNHEGVRLFYTVTVMTDKQVIGISSIVALNNGSTWEQPMSFVLPEGGNHQRVDFELWRQGASSPYRSLTLWVDVAPSP